MKKARLFINKKPVKNKQENTIILKLEKFSNFEYILNSILDSLRINYTNSKISGADVGILLISAFFALKS